MRSEVSMITTTLRIDEDTYNNILKIASEEERSINSQIVYMLKKYIEHEKKNNLKNQETVTNK